MANGGWHGTKEEWDRIERPLLQADTIIDKFANEVGLPVIKNYKDWPGRSISWGDDVKCLIQLYLVNDKELTFNLWLCASQDYGHKRYWKQETSVEQQKINEFKEDLEELLREGYEKLITWSSNKSMLEFAAELPG